MTNKTLLGAVLMLALYPMARTQTFSPIPQATAPPTKPTLAAFTGLPKDLTFDELVRRTGRPDEEVGSGVFIWLYHLADGSTVFANSNDAHGKRIDGVTHVVGDQNTKLYPVSQ